MATGQKTTGSFPSGRGSVKSVKRSITKNASNKAGWKVAPPKRGATPKGR